MTKLIKEKVPFTMVCNQILQDKFISPEEKGMYAYLYSKPEGWNFSADRICLENNITKKPVLRILTRLEELGYLVRSKLSTGRVEYTLNQKPKGQNGTLATEAKGSKRHHAELTPISNTVSTTNSSISNTNTETSESSVVISSNKKEKADANKEFGPGELQNILDGWWKECNEKENWTFAHIINIIEEKKIKIENEGQLQRVIGRNIVSARALNSDYSYSRVLEAMEKAKKLTDNWTLETVLKVLTSGHK